MPARVAARYSVDTMLATLLAAAPTITVASLLTETADLDTLTRRPSPVYVCAQSSSYERSSDPFANGDAGHFLRRDGNEDVMADLKGPGAVVRLWSANPSGTIRFYFDGETKPRIESPMEDLMTGKGPIKAPLSYEASQGFDIYLPMPYAKSLKVTVEGSKGLYYHVGYRTYPRGTDVRTISTDELGLAPASVPVRAGTKKTSSSTLAPGKSLSLDLSYVDGAEVTALQAKVPAAKIDLQTLRHLVLEADFDGETTVRAPLGDLYGAPLGPRALQTAALTVDEDGTLTCKFPMPFHKTAKFRITNVGAKAVPVSLTTTTVVRPWTPDSYLFHAQWQAFPIQTRPMRDLPLLHATGEGLYVATLLHVANPVPAWWGEGDEKVKVDGEGFPSIFGTGSEDYFGYAWCSPRLYQRAYHAQTRCDGPGNGGHSAELRLHIPDPIPFKNYIQFDIEAWHWADVHCTWASTNLWYAAPGGSGPEPISIASLEVPDVVATIPTVKGALEGESLSYTATGGKVEAQEGFIETSGGKQLWWVDPAQGDKLTIKFKAPKAGRYAIVANLCHARDYGIHKISINGQEAKTLDFFQPEGVTWKKIDLGTFDLPAGDSTIVVENVGTNPGAEPRRMFGLDYVLLQPK